MLLQPICVGWDKIYKGSPKVCIQYTNNVDDKIYFLVIESTVKQTKISALHYNIIPYNKRRTLINTSFDCLKLYLYILLY